MIFNSHQRKSHQLTCVLVLAVFWSHLVGLLASWGNCFEAPHHHGTRERIGNRTTRQSREPQIDAFDRSICGHANMRQWQLQQRAFGCSDDVTRQQTYDGCHSARRPIGSTSRALPFGGVHRISDGELAMTNEFPSFARVLHPLSGFMHSVCGGTLIHRNLVITVSVSR